MKDIVYKALITGGTGTIGSTVAKQALGWNITIFSNSEKELVEMKANHPHYKYVYGDITRYEDVARELKDSNYDYVFHFAALKHVNLCELQPTEATSINVIGTMNVINACVRYGVKMVNMSSDKAVNPVNIYGMTKRIGEAMATQAGFVSIRSGNVLWSTGSVLELWKNQLEFNNTISITSAEMTRFFVHPIELAMFILNNKNKTGVQTIEMKSFRLSRVAELFLTYFGDGGSRVILTGLREGERLHEYRDDVTSSLDCLSEDYDYIFTLW